MFYSSTQLKRSHSFFVLIFQNVIYHKMYLSLKNSFIDFFYNNQNDQTCVSKQKLYFPNHNILRFFSNWWMEIASATSEPNWMKLKLNTWKGFLIN